MAELASLSRYVGNLLRVASHPEMPPDLIFFVTSRCNARCSYCHFLAQIQDRRRKEHELSLEEIRRVAADYGPLGKLSLCGGEPFLRGDVAEIVECFVRRCGVGIVDIPTNGSLPSRVEAGVVEILRSCPGLILEIQLSLDGPEEVHESLRRLPGLFRRTLETMERLFRLRERLPGLRVKLNLTYQQGNEDAVERMVQDFDRRWRFDRFQITFPHGPQWLQDRIQRLSYQRFYRLSRHILRHMRLRSRRDLHSLLFRAIKLIRDEVLDQMLTRGDMGRFCQAGRRIVVLDDVGEVFPCEPLWESVGNVRDHGYSIRRVLRGAGMHRFAREHLGPGKCHCTWGCVVLDHIIHTPRYYPRILAYLAYLFLFGGRGLDRRPLCASPRT